MNTDGRSFAVSDCGWDGSLSLGLRRGSDRDRLGRVVVDVLLGSRAVRAHRLLDLLWIRDRGHAGVGAVFLCWGFRLVYLLAPLRLLLIINDSLLCDFRLLLRLRLLLLLLDDRVGMLYDLLLLLTVTDDSV